MKFELNINKSHAITIIVLLVITGFGIAQTAPDPGHIANQVAIGGSVNDNLENWATSTDSSVNNHEGRLDNIEANRWTASPIASPYYVAPLFSQPNIGTYSHDLPSSIPSTAKEVLVYAYVARGSGGGGTPPFDINIYTQQNPNQYINKLAIIDNNNNGAYVVNSDNMWLPVTSDRKIYVQLPVPLTGNFQSQIQIIGYR